MNALSGVCACNVAAMFPFRPPCIKFSSCLPLLPCDPSTCKVQDPTNLHFRICTPSQVLTSISLIPEMDGRTRTDADDAPLTELSQRTYRSVSVKYVLLSRPFSLELCSSYRVCRGVGRYCSRQGQEEINGRSRNNSAKTWGPLSWRPLPPYLRSSREYVLRGALLSGSQECRSGRDAKQSTIFGCPFKTEDGPHFRHE